MRLRHEPLFDFAATLGIEHNDLSNLETPARIAGTFEVPGSAAARLTAAVLDSLAAEYGDAVKLVFRIGALDEFTFDGSYLAGAFEEFLVEAGHTHTYDLLLQVEKGPLVERVLGGKPLCETVLYFTEDAAVAALRSGVGSVEKALWPDATLRLLVLVLDADGLLTGDWLSIVGGVHLDEAAREAARQPVDPELPVRAARRRDDYIGWDTQFTTNLTPWHFYVDRRGQSATTPYVDAAFVLLAILFTCDRARSVAGSTGRPRLQAEFRGREHVAYVPIIEGDPLLIPIEASTAIGSLVNWCYQTQTGESDSPDWLADRLPFVQLRVAQALEGRPEEGRFQAFATSMPDIYEGAAWQWRAFLEGRISEYLDKVRDVETAVANTVDQYAERTTALAKGLSDAMLAAVAALIGSFIAAAFKQPFDTALFRIGLLTYAVYVLIFPGLLGLLSSMGQMSETKLSFAGQRKQFEEALYKDKIEDIVGKRVSTAEARYQRWLRGVACGYLAVTVSAGVGAFVLPHYVGSRPVSAPTTTTTTAHIP